MGRFGPYAEDLEGYLRPIAVLGLDVAYAPQIPVRAEDGRLIPLLSLEAWTSLLETVAARQDPEERRSVFAAACRIALRAAVRLWKTSATRG